MNLAEQFAAAHQVVVIGQGLLEEYQSNPQWVAVCQYPTSKDFTPDKGEVGFVLRGGKIAVRVFTP